jgi:hypothetical protein
MHQLHISIIIQGGSDMPYVSPNQTGSNVHFKSRYDNCIGRELAAPSAASPPIMRLPYSST